MLRWTLSYAGCSLWRTADFPPEEPDGPVRHVPEPRLPRPRADRPRELRPGPDPRVVRLEGRGPGLAPDGRPAPGPPARGAGLRPGRQRLHLPARRHAAHGRGPRHGARPADARRARRLPPGRLVLSGPGGRRDLDGPLLPPVVRGDGQGPRP